MSHVREQIVQAIKTAVTGLATTGTSVTLSALDPIEGDTIPCLRVRYARGTEVSAASSLMTSIGNRVLERRVRLEVHGYTTGDDGETAETALNALAAEVEPAVADYAGPWSAITLVGTDIESDGDGILPYGHIALTFEAQYQTRANTPQTRA